MTHVQAIIFKRDLYDTDTARRWLRRHNYYPIKRVHVTINYLRYRLKEPDENKYDYRLKTITNGIKFVIGYPHNQMIE